MNDREALAAALDHCRPAGYPPELLPIFAAARERLAQLPEKCGTCKGVGTVVIGSGWAIPTCPTCHGSGTVYPPALVERIAETMKNHWKTDYRSIAVAVLDALNDTETP